MSLSVSSGNGHVMGFPVYQDSGASVRCTSRCWGETRGLSPHIPKALLVQALCVHQLVPGQLDHCLDQQVPWLSCPLRPCLLVHLLPLMTCHDALTPLISPCLKLGTLKLQPLQDGQRQSPWHGAGLFCCCWEEPQPPLAEASIFFWSRACSQLSTTHSSCLGQHT